MTRDEMKERIRSKATVVEGIIKRTEHNGAVYAEYEPGNGNKYRFVCFPCAGLDVGGTTDRHFMVSFLTPSTRSWRTYPFQGGEGQHIVPEYAGDKLDLGFSKPSGRIEAGIFCEVIPHLIGTGVMSLARIMDYVYWGK